MSRIVFKTFDLVHIEEAIRLVSHYYQEEKNEVSELPSFFDYHQNLTKHLKSLVVNQLGIVAIEDDIVIGFISGFSIPSFFGKAQGIFVPVYGHAAIQTRKCEIEQHLYVEAARRWVNQGIYTHSIAIFAHDKDLKDMWFHLGFGNRCIDAIRQVQSHNTINPLYQFEEITSQNVHSVVPIHEKHHQYYRQSPIFMPNQNEDALLDLLDWLKDSNHRMFSIKTNDQVVGYIRYQMNGESLFSIHNHMRNITGLYVLPEFRNFGIGEALLMFVENVLHDEKISLLGVDYESINPNAKYFWGKHFKPYTYSLVRRIDERIEDVEKSDESM